MNQNQNQYVTRFPAVNVAGIKVLDVVLIIFLAMIGKDAIGGKYESISQRVPQYTRPTTLHEVYTGPGTSGRHLFLGGAR